MALNIVSREDTALDKVRKQSLLTFQMLRLFVIRKTECDSLMILHESANIALCNPGNAVYAGSGKSVARKDSKSNRTISSIHDRCTPVNAGFCRRIPRKTEFRLTRMRKDKNFSSPH